MEKSLSSPTKLALTIGALLSQTPFSQPVFADEAKQLEVIEVTATRRAGSIQETPMNIAALDGDVLKQQHIVELTDVARWVPGLTVTEQGARGGSPIIVRGLNTNSSGPSSDGGTVATYLGEIPVPLDLRLHDVDRVEVLIGPQGTLYGAGSLGGAVRYILNKPDMDFASATLSADAFNVKEGGMGSETGVVVNLPLASNFALRANVNYFDNPGFIDYNYLVKEGGVSLPDPNWQDDNDISSNLTQQENANFEQTLTARLALLWQINDAITANLNYVNQTEETGGRSIVHFGALSQSNPLSEIVKPFESAYRYIEPQKRDTDLLSLELEADLGFADLVSATGISNQTVGGQRDQTDLLIRLDFGYEEMPSFSSFTREDAEQDSLVQEVRLVSKGLDEFNWIVGGFYNRVESEGTSKEYTPGFSQFVVDNWGGVQVRPDDLEYISKDHTTTEEKAIFGELGYQVNEQLNLTLGARFYQYSIDTASAVDLPLYYTTFEGAGQDEINLVFEPSQADDSGSLFKLGADYQLNKDVMLYGTISEGFRIGGANGVAACPSDLNPEEKQIVCALADEQTFKPDTTTNYELGVKSTWFKNRLTVNGSVFYVDWQDAQVQGATVNGQQPIITNAASAKSQGVELATRYVLSDNWTTYFTYSYSDAELTSDAPGLFKPVADLDKEQAAYYSGNKGDRLPGSAKQQVSLGVNYNTELAHEWLLNANYGLTAQSDVLTTVGGNNDGESLPGFGLSNAQLSLSKGAYGITVYANNLFDKYAYTSARRTQADMGLGKFDTPNGVELLRNYGHFLIQPRTIGVKFTYQFDAD